MVVDVDSVVSDLLCLLQERGVRFSGDRVDYDLVEALSDCIDVTAEQKMVLHSLQFALAVRGGERGLAWATLALLEKEHPTHSFVRTLSDLLVASYEDTVALPANVHLCVSGLRDLLSLCEREV